MATYNNIKKIKIGDNVFNLAIPTKTSDLTNDSGFVTTDYDEKVKVSALTSGTSYYPVLAAAANTASRQIDSTLKGFKYQSTAGTTSTVGTATLTLGNSTASGTANNETGVLRIYGTKSKYHDLRAVDGYPTLDRTVYFPRYANNMYLTCTSNTNAVGGATTAPVYVDNTGCIQVVTSIPYSLLTGTPAIPTKTSQLTNDSGFVTTDENVKSTAVTAATTNYIVGSTTSTTTTGGLSKHASAVLYTTADSGTSGYTQLRLGNTTATTSAGGKEGQIRLYGTNATYYLDLKPGAIASSNKTITFPNKDGTVALIPTEGIGGPGTNAVVYNTTNGFVSIKGAYFYQSTSNNECYLSLGGNGGAGKGSIKLHTSDTNWAVELAPINSLSEDRTITLPNKDGTVALTSDIPSITLNGSSSTSPSFYAPTEAGTSGYYLKSNGSGAPTWKAFPTIPTITDTYSSTSSNGMSGKAVASALGSYLPLSGGTMTGPITMAHGVSNAVYGTLQDGSASLPMLSMTYGDSTVENYIALGATNNNIPIGIYGSNVYLTNGGNLTLQGNITVRGHAGNIGSVVTSDDTVSNLATGTDIAKQTAATFKDSNGKVIKLGAGSWVITATVRYTSNATGRRSVAIYIDTTSYASSYVTIPAASGTTTKVQTTLATSQESDFNVYIGMQQNSGSSLNGQWYLRAIRVA